MGRFWIKSVLLALLLSVALPLGVPFNSEKATKKAAAAGTDLSLDDATKKFNSQTDLSNLILKVENKEAYYNIKAADGETVKFNLAQINPYAPDGDNATNVAYGFVPEKYPNTVLVLDRHGAGEIYVVPDPTNTELNQVVVGDVGCVVNATASNCKVKANYENFKQNLLTPELENWNQSCRLGYGTATNKSARLDISNIEIIDRAQAWDPIGTIMSAGEATANFVADTCTTAGAAIVDTAGAIKDKAGQVIATAIDTAGNIAVNAAGFVVDATGAIKDAAGNVVAWATDTAGNIISTGWEVASASASWIFDNVIMNIPVVKIGVKIAKAVVGIAKAFVEDKGQCGLGGITKLFTAGIGGAITKVIMCFFQYILDYIIKGYVDMAGKAIDSGTLFYVMPTVDQIADSSILSPSYWVGTAHADTFEMELKNRDGFLYEFWNFTLDLINYLVIFSLLLLAFTNILHININVYAVKKVFPMLVLGVLGANASLFIIRFMADTAQALTYLALETVGLDTVKDLFWAMFVHWLFLCASAAVTLFWTGPIIGIVLMILTLWFLYTALMSFFVFIKRTAALYFLTMIAPLAFVAYGVPGLNQYMIKWWRAFLGFLYCFPAFVFALGMIWYFSTKVNGFENLTQIAGGGATTDLFSAIIFILITVAGIMFALKIPGQMTAGAIDISKAAATAFKYAGNTPGIVTGMLKKSARIANSKWGKSDHPLGLGKLHAASSYAGHLASGGAIKDLGTRSASFLKDQEVAGSQASGWFGGNYRQRVTGYKGAIASSIKANSEKYNARGVTYEEARDMTDEKYQQLMDWVLDKTQQTDPTTGALTKDAAKMKRSLLSAGDSDINDILTQAKASGVDFGDVNLNEGFDSATGIYALKSMLSKYSQGNRADMPTTIGMVKADLSHLNGRRPTGSSSGESSEEAEEAGETIIENETQAVEEGMKRVVMWGKRIKPDTGGVNDLQDRARNIMEAIEKLENSFNGVGANLDASRSELSNLLNKSLEGVDIGRYSVKGKEVELAGIGKDLAMAMGHGIHSGSGSVGDDIKNKIKEALATEVSHDSRHEQAAQEASKNVKEKLGGMGDIDPDQFAAQIGAEVGNQIKGLADKLGQNNPQQIQGAIQDMTDRTVKAMKNKIFNESFIKRWGTVAAASLGAKKLSTMGRMIDAKKVAPEIQPPDQTPPPPPPEPYNQ